jgi:hypothetical protein
MNTQMRLRHGRGDQPAARSHEEILNMASRRLRRFLEPAGVRAASPAARLE